jgi:hypothetical protein
MSQDTRSKTTYTSTLVKSFEHLFSSLSYTFVNGNGLISLAPIFDEFVNKTPKSGDNVYDYDNKINFSIDPVSAISLKTAIEAFMESEEKSLTMELGSDKTARSITLFAPNKIKLAKKHYDNYVMRVTVTKDGNEEKYYHIMNFTSVKFESDDGVTEEQRIEADMLLLIKFLEAIIENALSVSVHAIRRMGSNEGGNTSKSSRSSRRVVEDDDDNDDDSEESEPVTTSRKVVNKRKVDADLEAEFED